MKKIILTCVSLFFLLALAVLAAAGWRLIRPESIRPGFERALGQYFDAQARVGGIDWIWVERSPGLQLKSIGLSSAASASADSPEASVSPNAFFAEKIRLVLDLPALLNKEFKVRTLRLDRLGLELTRTADGLEAAGIELPPKPRPARSSWGKFSWTVEDLRITGGSLRYRDLTGPVPRTINLQSVDFVTKPVRASSRLDFYGSAGFLAAMPNSRFEGSYTREPDGGWSAELSRLRLGLEKIPVRALEQAFPELESIGLRGQFAGAVSGAIQTIRHDGRRLLDLAGNLRLEGIKIFVRAFKSPIQNLNADVHFDRDTIVISSLDGQIAGGDFIGKAEAKNLNKSDPDASFEFRAERVVLSNLLPRPSDGRPELTGRASLQIGGKVQGRRSAEWMSSLEARGSAALVEGALTNVNILRLIFDKLAASLPGAQEAFAGTMPPEIAQKLSNPNTLLAPVEIAFIIGNGGVVYPDVRVAGDGFEITGSGQQGFGGDIEFRAILTLDASTSSYLQYACPDTSAIADRSGRLSLPVRLTGTIRNIRVIPDTQYLIQRVVSLKGSGYLMKALQGRN